ncbi:MAG: hypothetical protein JWL76_478 [Thermoleophilia bacterium]|nr:hypothetical protein [Thermoleophilia bacterium]
MATYAFAAPVLDGLTDKYRAFTQALVTSRREEAETSRRAAGLDREQVFLQPTPMGDVAVIVWETNDFAKVSKHFGTDTSDFGAWFRSSLETFHGFDIAKVDMPTPVLVDEWKDATWTHGLDSWAFMFPVKDVAAWKTFVGELLGARREEFSSTRLAFGVKRASFFQVHTPNGPLAVQYIQGEAGAFPKAAEATATSTEPLYTWWREQMQAVAAVPMFQGSTPMVEELIDFQVKVPANA